MSNTGAWEWKFIQVNRYDADGAKLRPACKYCGDVPVGNYFAFTVPIPDTYTVMLGRPKAFLEVVSCSLPHCKFPIQEPK